MQCGFVPAAPPVGAGAASVVRAPGLKRGKQEEAVSDRIKLETVFGLTVGSNAALDCDPNTELVAYPAGCTVVLYNPRKNRQTHVLNASRKSVTCVAFSPDGRYLATGESGHAPAVRVWDLHDPAASGAVQTAEFPGHTHGVSCVAFSMTSKYLVSVGSQHDMIVNVWDWQANLKLASNKVSSRVVAVSFAESGNYFVTVGFRHVKFWYLEYSRNAKFKEPVPLMGRSAILGEQKDNEFCDVRCGRGPYADSTYAITRSGLLCEFNSRRMLDKWVELRTTSANCMSLGANYIFIGCAEGIVRCFEPGTLHFVTTLPRTHYLGVDVSQGTNISHMFSQPAAARYPDAVAVAYDARNHKLTCVYNDHSLYVWDVRDIKRVGKSHSALYHSACIWGVEMCGNSFVTCSSDDTVRLWTLAQGPNTPASNIYSLELQKVLYIDPDMKFLKDVDLTTSSDKDKGKSYDDKTGVRCVKTSPDGAHIASGDRAGNIWIHDARRGTLLHMLEAHDAEVLCLEYSSSKPYLLASASRDRLLHVFMADKGYQILQTLDDHSSSIMAVRFLSSPNGLQMVSCGADKTILFRNIVHNPDGTYQFGRGANVSGRTTLYDMEVDAGGRHVMTACQDRNIRVYSATQQRHTKTFRGTVADTGMLIKVALDSSGIYLATSCTDKILSVYDYYSGECMATMYGHSEIVTGLKFTPDCQHLISASGDGCIFVWRVPHDMVVTMRARLSQQAIRQGKKGATNGLSALDSESDSQLGSPPRHAPDANPAVPLVPDYTLRIGRLPSWAKKSLGDEAAATETSPPEPPARGKWARRINHDKRIDSDGSKDSSLDSGTDTRYVDKRRDQNIIKQRPKSLNLSQLPRVEALFKDFDKNIKNTYDILTLSPRAQKVTISGVTRTLEPPRTRHHTDDSSLGSFKYEDQESTEHDGDIEDISDGERTSSSESRNRPLYYPGNNDDTPTEFTVNAMDVEELRASQRRSKRFKMEKLQVQLPAAVSVSGSGLSSDDEDVSTPSGDNTERNPLSSSFENLDISRRREKLLKSAFDNLSGAEMDSSGHGGNTSLSSQHLSRGGAAAGGGASPGAAGSARPGQAPAPAPRTTAPAPSHAAAGLDPAAQRKREELNRRIRETRRQLESVGFRSSLKSSQSTTDLSYIPEKDQNSRLSSRARPISMAPATNRFGYNVDTEELDSLNTNYFDSLNFADTKSPYAIPANLNYRSVVPNLNHAHYSNVKANIIANNPSNFTPFNIKPLPTKYELADREKKFDPKIKENFKLNFKDDTNKLQPKAARAKSIFKNYKSCPVSPVSEECKWADKASKNEQTVDTRKRNSLAFFIGLDGTPDTKSVASIIKSDTEKMIAEIKQKYGDLDDLDTLPTKESAVIDDGNFSSDSLEDCSLSQDASCKNKYYSKKICKKHQKPKCLPRRCISDYEIYSLDVKPAVPAKPSFIVNQKSSTLPRNMPSNFDELIENMDKNFNVRCQSVLTKRCVTLSNESILSDNSNGSSVSNEIFMKYGDERGFQQARVDSRYLDSQNTSNENLNDSEAMNLDPHRYSSASFFLNQKRLMKNSHSQESILSDDIFDNDHLSRTNCNSLESVLSDDSDYTRSAPLEMLFESAKKTIPMVIQSNKNFEGENTSKSYGSSPNYNHGSYMYNNYVSEICKNYTNYSYAPKCTQSIVNSTKPDNKVLGFEVPEQSVMPRSKSLYDSSTKKTTVKNVAYYIDSSNVQQYTRDNRKDEIPRMKAHDYVSKSLRPGCQDKHKYDSIMEGCGQNPMIKSKSCSFEVVLEPPSKPNPLKFLKDKQKSHVQKNLEKFEAQIRKNAQTKLSKNQNNSAKANAKINNVTKSLERNTAIKNSSKIHMEFVPHKPPKPIKRTSSVKLNNKLKSNVEKKMGSQMSSQYKARLDGLTNKNYRPYKATQDNNCNQLSDSDTEKTFEVYVQEKDVNENKCEIQLDSLDVSEHERSERKKQISLDSLDFLDNCDNFAQDSLDYPSIVSKEQIAQLSHIDIKAKCKKEKSNSFLKKEKDEYTMCTAYLPVNIPSRDTRICDEIKKYKNIERKIEIINKLVEMEERKMLQEKYLKEKRMQPLEANIDNGKGVVKVLSRKFENLVNKQNTLPHSFTTTWEDGDTDSDQPEVKDIKRNLSLPDILDTEQMTTSSDLITDISDISEVTVINKMNLSSGSENSSSLKDADVFVPTEIDNSSNVSNIKTTQEITARDDAIKNESKSQTSTSKEIDYKDTIDTELYPENVQLNNLVISSNLPPRLLQKRVYNEMVIPKTDLHIDSENYESSTTSSSCTNSPKRYSLCARTKRPMIRSAVPRPCNTSIDLRVKIRPIFACGVGIRATNVLARRVPLQPMLPSKFLSPAGRNSLEPYDVDEDGTGMRRAISLSDLAVKPVPAPRTPVQASGKAPAPAPPKAPAFSRPQPRYAGKAMTRSSSVGVLNQSDSESDGQPASRGGARGTAGLMRPTISSLNKAAAAAARRRPLTAAYSTVNLAGAGGGTGAGGGAGPGGAHDESSSEADERQGKPAVPPRPRAVSVDHTANKRMGRSGSDRDLSSKAKEVTDRLTSGVRSRLNRQDSKDSTQEMQLSSEQVCAALTEQLTRTATKVVQLYASLQHEPARRVDGTGAAADNNALINGLEAAILETQKVLRSAALRQSATNGKPNGDAHSSLSSTDGEQPSKSVTNIDSFRHQVEELLSKGGGTSNINMLAGYSDILLKMMQSTVANNYPQPQSMPNTSPSEAARDS